MLHGQTMQLENTVLADIATVAAHQIPLYIVTRADRDFEITEKILPREAHVAVACGAHNGGVGIVGSQLNLPIHAGEGKVQTIFLTFHINSAPSCSVADIVDCAAIAHAKKLQRFVPVQ